MNVMSLRNVKKAYPLYRRKKDKLLEAFSLTGKSYHTNFYALNGVSFDIQRGECVGIIGLNGSGKSTLLKLICGILKPYKGTVDVYSGNDDQIVPVLSLGGKGVISVLSNILPKETHDMVASYLEGDVAKSCEMQLKYFDLVKALFCEVNPIPVKKALNLMGMEVGSLRLPLTEMEDANAKRLEEEMRKAGVIK